MATGTTPSNAINEAEADGLPAPPSRKSLALWLVVIGMSLLFLPLFLTLQTIQKDNLRLEAALSQAQTAVVTIPTLPAEAQNLQATATAVQAQMDQLGPVYEQLVAGHVDWPHILALISEYDDTQLVVVGVSQAENRLVITGRADSDSAVVAYTQALEDTGQFSRIVIQSITQLALPIHTATPVATPTQVSALDTPEPIFLKQPLLKTFETSQEEHTAVFLVKADRFYEVSTLKLAPGVDTVLTVSLAGGPTYTNDDDGPGTLASKISFQAPASNTQVIIRVTNLGQPGPEMSYQILVQEVVLKNSSDAATGTPVSSSTLVATLTAVPTSTPTTIPTALPTATLPPPPTLAATGGAVAFAILVEVKP